MTIPNWTRWTILVLAAVVTGVLATKPVMSYMVDRLAIHNGPWRTSAGVGSADANLYERAAVAVAGLYGLAKEETIYYTAFTDSDGQELNGRCDYTLSGRPFPTRWWSLTMYGADYYLVENPANIYSRHAGNLEFEPDHSYMVQISAQAKPHNWLPTPANGEFSITLRLYNPEAAIHEHLGSVQLPSIQRENCR